MGLEAFAPKTEAVEFPGGEFTVRALNLEDIAYLVRRHQEPISVLFDKYVTEQSAEIVDQVVTEGEMGMGDVKGVVLEGLEMAPGLIADVIARAADEHERPEIARLLPMGTQVDAIEKVIRLTLDTEGGLEKLVETVTRVAESMAGLSVDRPR